MTPQEIRDAVLASPELEALARLTTTVQVHQKDEQGYILKDQSGDPLPLLDVVVAQPDTTAIAAALSAGRTKVASVTRAAFASWAAKTGMRAKISDQSVTAASPLRSSALALLDVLNGASETIDFASAENIAMLNGWVQATLLSQADHDELLLLATVDDPVPEFDVRVALLNDDGTLRI